MIFDTKDNKDDVDRILDTVKENKKSNMNRKKKIASGIAVLVMLIIAGGITGYVFRKKQINEQIEEFSKYVLEFEQIENEYGLGTEEDNYYDLCRESLLLIRNKNVDGIADLMENMEILKSKIIDMNEQIKEYEEIYEGFNSRINEYIISESDLEKSKDIIDELEIALEEFDLKESKKYSQKLESFEEGIKESSIQNIQEIQRFIKNYGQNNLFGAEQFMLNNRLNTAEMQYKEQKFASAYTTYNECVDILDTADMSNYYTLELEQVDETNYPTTKLYLKAAERYTGTVVDFLDSSKFTLWEKYQDKYEEKTINKSSIMNEKESLNIGIVADVSASMEYGIYIAEEAMNSLVSNMQFHVGDRAALYSFADTVKREQYFTDNKNDMTRAIYGLEQGNMTAFYDALAFSLSEIIVQDGAKCIIAFTDGIENYSVSSKDYIIQKAKQYKVPIYIIGIGNWLDSSSLQEIASKTGGTYRNINNVADMSAIYQTIYREQKARYVLEYNTTEQLGTNEERVIYVKYNDGDAVIRTETTYVPGDYTIDGFIFYDSDSRYLTRDELDKLTEAEVRIALNEIYARRGYIFQTAEDMKAHFYRMDWYKGTENDMNTVARTFNEFEKKNVDLLVDYEIVHKLNGRLK